MTKPAMQPLELNHGTLALPAYLPDATLGVVRALDAADLEGVGVPALVMNVFHLMQRPGTSTIQALGGLHRMSAWKRPIVTDSGGFQAYSLIRQNAKFGKLTDQGISFQPENADRKFQLTPEKSVQLQMTYGADIVICLDDCTHVDDSFAEQQLSVQRTVRWAKRCKEEFERQLRQRKADGPRPQLFAVVQGGGEKALRKECAEALLEIGFDGYGYGGWPLDAKGKLLHDILAYTREVIPSEFPLHALGVGHPENVLDCFKLGYGIFDSALPTRDARSGRLYRFTDDAPGRPVRLEGHWFDYLYVDDKKHIKDSQPISSVCDCYTCRNYAVGYLHHLSDVGDVAFQRLTTIHNLRFMMRLMDMLRL